MGVIGTSELHLEFYHAPELIGREIACQAVILTSGLAGAIEAAPNGVKAAGSFIIGSSLDSRRKTPTHTSICLSSRNLSGVRNLILVRTAEVLIAVGGGTGTHSKITFALKLHKQSIRFESWQLADDIIAVYTPQDSVARAFELLDSRSSQGR